MLGTCQKNTVASLKGGCTGYTWDNLATKMNNDMNGPYHSEQVISKNHYK